MSSRLFVTALRRAATMARPTVMAAARPALRQTALKAAVVCIAYIHFCLIDTFY
jgi:hypothetical protein